MSAGLKTTDNDGLKIIDVPTDAPAEALEARSSYYYPGVSATGERMLIVPGPRRTETSWHKLKERLFGSDLTDETWFFPELSTTRVLRKEFETKGALGVVGLVDDNRMDFNMMDDYLRRMSRESSEVVHDFVDRLEGREPTKPAVPAKLAACFNNHKPDTYHGHPRTLVDGIIAFECSDITGVELPLEGFESSREKYQHLYDREKSGEKVNWTPVQHELTKKAVDREEKVSKPELDKFQASEADNDTPLARCFNSRMEIPRLDHESYPAGYMELKSQAVLHQCQQRVLVSPSP